jgi:hypothetical protein
MSSLKFWASEASEALAVTGLQPTLPRSWLTRASTAAWAEVGAGDVVVLGAAGAEAEVLGAAGLDAVAGAELFVGAAEGVLEAERRACSVAAAAFVFVVFVGSEVFDGDADGVPALGEADFVGALPRSALRLAAADADARSEADAEAEADARPAGAVVEPPCVRRSGAPWERTWSAAGPPLTW